MKAKHCLSVYLVVFMARKCLNVTEKQTFYIRNKERVLNRGGYVTPLLHLQAEIFLFLKFKGFSEPSRVWSFQIQKILLLDNFFIIISKIMLYILLLFQREFKAMQKNIFIINRNELRWTWWGPGNHILTKYTVCGDLLKHAILLLIHHKDKW